MATSKQTWLQFGIGNLTSTAVTVAYTGTQGRTAKLPVGIYRVTVTTDAHLLQGTVAATAAATDTYLAAGESIDIEVGTGTEYVSAIQATAGGDLFCTLLAG